ncbi:MAG: serine/threonine-protein phosphatase [Actinomycetota bacterium]|nr:serine/threonine-protein phosphatase [Actinomycetota bacterium]
MPQGEPAPPRSGGPGPARGDQGDLAATAERVLADLLGQSHLLRPDAIEEVFARAAAPLGVHEVRVYLADLQQQVLESLPSQDGRDSENLVIDSTIAGYAYRTFTVQHLPAGDRYRVWVPLVNGTDRLGVLSLLVSDVGEAMLARYRTLASLAGLVIVAKSTYSDTFAYARRTEKMALQAELMWALVAPRTFATDRVLVAAALEPAYEAGGDSFDYSLLGDHLHVSIFDALGHDLAAGLLASVAMASCRSTRRAGGTLPDVAARADHAIAGQFGASRFVTALLCDLNLVTGLFSWIPCGHPPPLLLRGNKVVKELFRRPQLPLGLGAIDHHAPGRTGSGEPPGEDANPVSTERLEPGDRLLLYTDGVTEGWAADGTPFGLERLGDFIIRHSHDGITLPETLRRLNHAITDHQRGHLRDDATLVVIQWRPDHPERSLTP